MPAISVIVPVYNTEKYLRRCIDSIVHQSFTDFKLILVDDGSTDHSFEILKEYEANDHRVVVLHQKNQGQAVARNTGLDWIKANSACDWVMFVDSDDWIHLQTLEILFAQTSKYDVNTIIGGYAIAHNDDYRAEDVTAPTVNLQTAEDFYCQYQDEWAVMPIAKLYRAANIMNIRFPIARACEDEGFTYKMLFQSRNVVVVNEPLYIYYMSDNSTMRKPWNPNRMYVITALEERVRFFKSHHYEDAYNKAMILFLYGTLFEPIVNINAMGLNQQYKKERRKMIWKLRYVLISFWHKGEISPKNGEYVKLFESMFPRFMKIYWIAQRFK